MALMLTTSPGERAGRALLERPYPRVPASEVRLHRDDALLLLFVVVEIPACAVREGEARPAGGQRHRSPLGRRAPRGDDSAVAVDRQVEELVCRLLLEKKNSTAYHLLACFPFIQEPPAGYLSER